MALTKKEQEAIDKKIQDAVGQAASQAAQQAAQAVANQQAPAPGAPGQPAPNAQAPDWHVTFAFGASYQDGFGMQVSDPSKVRVEYYDIIGQECFGISHRMRQPRLEQQIQVQAG